MSEIFIDISHEEFRVYTFVEQEKFYKVKIDKPLKLIKEKDGDRIYDIKGLGHFIPKGWIHLFWKDYDDNDDEEDKKENKK